MKAKNMHGILTIRGIEFNTAEVCEALTRHVESVGDEMFEKNLVIQDEIVASVFCIIGPNASELTALVREWAHKNHGLTRTR